MMVGNRNTLTEMVSESLLTATFSAFSDPTRREVLRRLRGGELVVGERAEPLEMSWPAVTKHLKVLEAAGLLDRRREGRKHVVSLNAGPIEEAGQWMSFYWQFWVGSLDRPAEHLESESPDETG